MLPVSKSCLILHPKCKEIEIFIINNTLFLTYTVVEDENMQNTVHTFFSPSVLSQFFSKQKLGHATSYTTAKTSLFVSISTAPHSVSSVWVNIRHMMDHVVHHPNLSCKVNVIYTSTWVKGYLTRLVGKG